MVSHLSAAPSAGMKKPSVTKAAGTLRPTAAFDAAWASLDDTLERLGEGLDVFWMLIDPERRGGERLPAQNRFEFLIRALRQEHSEADGLLQQLGALADALEAQRHQSGPAQHPRGSCQARRIAKEGDSSLPDADLITLCAEHIANLKAYEDSPGNLAPEADPLWAAYARTRDDVWDAQPMTLKGILAKAHAAKAVAEGHEGRGAPSGSLAADFAWQLVDDLLRLEGSL
ncbi:hypothetical protein [Roseomonas sp. USHLN139]|uniref:hypothetical protein n=1 Tax=Roseomonas sp. USHLN139 TaxID=3081298 RepID=UPI003B026D68